MAPLAIVGDDKKKQRTFVLKQANRVIKETRSPKLFKLRNELRQMTKVDSPRHAELVKEIMLQLWINASLKEF